MENSETLSFLFQSSLPFLPNELLGITPISKYENLLSLVYIIQGLLVSLCYNIPCFFFRNLTLSTPAVCCTQISQLTPIVGFNKHTDHLLNSRNLLHPLSEGCVLFTGTDIRLSSIGISW